MHKRALEEDPSVFDYDGVYENMKETEARPVRQDRSERQVRRLLIRCRCRLPQKD